MSTLQNNIERILIDCNRPVKGKYVVFHSNEALRRIMKEIEEGPKLLMNIDNVRNVIDWYAKRMEKRLKENDAIKGKEGWHDGRLAYYAMMAMKCLQNIVSLFKEDDRQFPNAPIINPLSLDVKLEGVEDIKEKDIYFAIKKCIDGGNFLMMLADNLRDILLERGIKK